MGMLRLFPCIQALVHYVCSVLIAVAMTSHPRPFNIWAVSCRSTFDDSDFTSAPDLSRLKHQVMTARDQLLKLDWPTPELMGVPTRQARRQKIKRIAQMPCIA